jgi:hypothetical protein
MADKKVTQLTQVAVLPDTAKIYAVDTTRAIDDQDVQITKSNLLADATPTIQDVLIEGNEINAGTELIFKGAFNDATFINTTSGLTITDPGILRISRNTNFINFDTDAVGITGTADYSALTVTPELDRLTFTQRGYVDDAVDGKTTTDIGTEIPLDSAIGHQCNMATANTNTAYTLGVAITGAVTRVFVNATTQPTITGATQEGGIPFEADADMYMAVFNKGTDISPDVVYWFYYKDIVSVGYTVATLPTGEIGQTAYVTDSTAPTYLGALIGGGAVVCPVFHNGDEWVSH